MFRSELGVRRGGGGSGLQPNKTYLLSSDFEDKNGIFLLVAAGRKKIKIKIPFIFGVNCVFTHPAPPPAG